MNLLIVMIFMITPGVTIKVAFRDVSVIGILVFTCQELSQQCLDISQGFLLDLESIISSLSDMLTKVDLACTELTVLEEA